jgi:hypothetical protein
MKTVDVANLDPLRNFLVHIQEIDAGIAAQEWRAIHSMFMFNNVGPAGGLVKLPDLRPAYHWVLHTTR